ncbi:MAG: Zn-dependent protease [Desulforhopalus sp.]|jgi:Zn-dependent protease
MDGEFYLPYLINYSQPMVEGIAIFCVAMFTAIIASAEGQAFAATFLGDSEPGATDRLHFNVFLHMSVLGTLCFFIAGFGWAKQIQFNTANFKRSPKLSLIASRLSGPLANLLMANVAASLSWVLSRYDVEDKVFSTIVVVNITMAVYSLIPIPPLPGGVFSEYFGSKGDGARKVWRSLCLIGPYLIVGLFLLFRITGYEGLSSLINPVVLWLTNFALDI